MDTTHRGRHAPDVVVDGANAAVRFARWTGVVYAALGIVGFGVTGFGGFARTVGERLLLLEVNPLQNALHLVVGVVLIVTSAVGTHAAKTAGLLTAASFGVAGMLGFALTGTDANVLAVNTAANTLHLTTALVAAACATATRTTATTTAA